MQNKCTEELLLLPNELFCITFYSNKKTFTQTGIILFCSGLWDYLNHLFNNWFNSEHPSFWQWKAFEKPLKSICSHYNNSLLMNEWKQTVNLHMNLKKHNFSFFFLDLSQTNLISSQQILRFILLFRIILTFNWNRNLLPDTDTIQRGSWASLYRLSASKTG